MILAALGLAGIGLWFLLAGDGPAKLLGLALILLAGLFGFLFWIAVAVERPDASVRVPGTAEEALG